MSRTGNIKTESESIQWSSAFPTKITLLPILILKKSCFLPSDIKVMTIEPRFVSFTAFYETRLGFETI